MSARTDRLQGRRFVFSHVAFLLAILACAFPVAPTSAADLTATQQKALDEAKSNLKQVETNLKLAMDAAGPGEGQPAAGKVRLAMTRLNSAKPPIPLIEARLADLPADHPDVASTQQQFDAVRASIAKLEARLTGGASAPAEGPAQGVRLDYRQEEQLKNARFHLRDLEGMATALTQLVEQVKAAGDPLSLDHRLVQQGMNTLDTADRRIREIQTHLEGLPAEGQGVAQVTNDYNGAVVSVQAARSALTPVHDQIIAAIDPGKYPDLKTDTERLRELARMYGSLEVFEMDRAQAASLVREGPAAIAERERVDKAYALLVLQQTPDGEQVAGASRYFREKYEAFAAAAGQQREALPGQIAADLDSAKKLAEQAVAEKKPAFFNGGIPQQIGFAQEKLALLEALGTQSAKASAEQMAQTQAELRQTQATLRNDIIAANELPPDRFGGEDREEVVRLATETLKKGYPDARVLAARIPGQAWKREVLWSYQSGSWTKTDRSRLQVQLIVPHDDKLAVIQPVNLVKDHLGGDQISAYLFHEKGEELEPQSFLPLAKVQ